MIFLWSKVPLNWNFLYLFFQLQISHLRLNTSAADNEIGDCGLFQRRGDRSDGSVCEVSSLLKVHQSGLLAAAPSLRFASKGSDLDGAVDPEILGDPRLLFDFRSLSGAPSDNPMERPAASASLPRYKS